MKCFKSGNAHPTSIEILNPFQRFEREKGDQFLVGVVSAITITRFCVELHSWGRFYMQRVSAQKSQHGSSDSRGYISDKEYQRDEISCASGGGFFLSPCSRVCSLNITAVRIQGRSKWWEDYQTEIWGNLSSHACSNGLAEGETDAWRLSGETRGISSYE